jgi:hypothetical protein
VISYIAALYFLYLDIVNKAHKIDISENKKTAMLYLGEEDGIADGGHTYKIILAANFFFSIKNIRAPSHHTSYIHVLFA